ncbi:hypothetical protein DOTSEDRAFT_23957 [Dothistroma septosporum NZE10]|uniref:Uncharacterized protein n=1 Tax=Dothistroma septosporum (strain NZE10 / CBS 128990) TaxID=675120 RepID=N1PJY9_DOTSN|nr:hypothetical protein DOTSEDRAFT_23957 [Dothistroma septosporum NZE10]
MQYTLAALALAAMASAIPAPAPQITPSPKLDERQLGVFPISASGSLVGGVGPVPISIPIDSLKLYPSSVLDVCLGGVCLPEITTAPKPREVEERALPGVGGIVTLSGGQDGTIGLASGSFGPIIDPTAIKFCDKGSYDGANSYANCPIEVPLTLPARDAAPEATAAAITYLY